jgi:O-antigen/teichoic acid export membrane protein
LSATRASQAAGRRAAANTILQAAGELSGKIATFVLFAVLARRLGASAVGAYVLAFAYVQIVTVLIDLGFDRVVIRRVAVDVAHMPALFTNVVALKIAIAVPVTAASWVVAGLLGYSETTRLAIYVLSAGLLLDSLNRTVAAVLLSRERSGLLAGSVVAQRVTGAALGIAALLAGYGVLSVCVAYAAGSLIGLVVGVGLMVRQIGAPARTLERHTWPELAREAVPFALYNSLGFVLTKVDTIVLSLLATQTAVAAYGAASRLYEASFFLTFSLNGAFVAMFTYLTPTSEPTVGAVFQRSIKLALAVLIPIAVVLMVVPEPVTTLFFGGNLDAAEPLRLLAPSVVLMGVVNLAAGIVALRSGPGRLIPLTGFIMALNVGLNVVLIPPLDAAGPGLAMSISLAAFAVIGLRLAVAEVGRLQFGRMLASPLAAGAVMALVMAAAGPPVVAVAAGLVAFAVAFAAAERLVAPDDLRFVADLVLRRASSAPAV